MPLKKVLVVFYSRTGFTRGIAEAVAEACGADIEEVQDVRSRRGLIGFLRSGYEASTRKLPEIKETTADPAQYDVVIIGTPVWAGNISSPIRSYVAKHRDRLKAVALFCTMAGKDPSKNLPELAQACGAEPLATISVRDKDIKAGLPPSKVEDFVRPLMNATPAAAN